MNKFVTILKKSQSFVSILLCHCFWHHHRYQNCDDVIDNLSRTANSHCDIASAAATSTTGCRCAKSGGNGRNNSRG